MPDGKIRILFIEDDAAKRYVIARQLRAAGFEVDEATTGEEGLGKIRPEHHIAILDMRLPDMHGWDICRRIKENPRTAAVKVLELSATLATAEDRARGLELGADCYLVHPVEMVELTASLRALARLRQAEDDKARAQELFLGALGHDLRNPLNTISTGMELLQTSEAVAAEHGGTLQRMSRAMDRMCRMIDQLLVFTQSLHETVPMKRQPVDLAELARSVARDAAHASPHPIQVHAEAPAPILGDAGKLMQLVDNLVGNAIRYGEGTVTVRVGRDGGDAMLRVHNHGQPIPPAALPTLFEPFTRASGRGGGFGLGLYIVDQIARKHDGSVAVASNPEAGTTFTVRLPAASQPTASAPAP
ncbi:MAG TPA: ATP-binding protein [Kofleriaceae bacterium]|nr:ATP-binding protein [Kofleriaceae bacterium]